MEDLKKKRFIKDWTSHVEVRNLKFTVFSTLVETMKSKTILG